jgi:very-short-patch-repair endonuclease
MTKAIEDHRDFIIEAYTTGKKSTYEISQELGTYPNKIRRALKKFGVELRDKSSAQAQAIKSGRHKHPTKGQVRSKEDRVKISEGMSEHWTGMDDQERKRRSEMAKKQWEGMSDEEKFELRRAAAEGVRRAAKEGSKVEKFLYHGLTERGHNVIFHKEGLVRNQNLEVDLFLPNAKIAIEVDGPAHFLPIWGEENLQKRVKSDAIKSGLLLTAGFVVLRIKHITKNLSQKKQRDLLLEIVSIVETVGNKPPPLQDRFIEIEL